MLRAVCENTTERNSWPLSEVSQANRLNDSYEKVSDLEEDSNSYQRIYITKLYDILETEKGSNIQLERHINYLPVLDEKEIILILSLSCLYDNQRLKTKIINKISDSKFPPENSKTSSQVVHSLQKMIKKQIKKDPTFDIFTSFIRKRVIGQSLIVAVKDNLQKVYMHILHTSEELLINRKCLIDLARKRELKILKSLLKHKYVKIQDERSKISVIFRQLYGREGRPFNQISLIGVISNDQY